MSKPINIIGAGLAGSLLALLLAQKGYKVNVFERREDMRKIELDAGRSINLALSVRGLRALDKAGLKSEILDIAIPMPGRMIHDLDGKQNFQPYSKDPNHYINSVSRADLNIRLMNASEAHEDTTFYFQHTCKKVDFRKGTVYMEDQLTGKVKTLKDEITIGCDGAFSAMRYSMQKTPRFNFSQDYLDHGYKELIIPAGPNNTYRMDPNALHIWPRGKYMMIALPNLDKSFTCTLFFPYKGKNSFESLQTQEDVAAFFDETFPDAVPHMPTLLEDFFENPTGSLVTIKCFPWTYGEKFALLGDASHAVVPFFGQGMNAAFEDCSVLVECLEENDGDWPATFKAYENSRKPNADAIATMAIENYYEMRDHVADPTFVFQKKVEHMLEKTHPVYKSRYEMVSFSNIPYAEAYRRGKINQQILEKISEGIDQVDAIDMDYANKVIDEMLT